MDTDFVADDFDDNKPKSGKQIGADALSFKEMVEMKKITPAMQRYIELKQANPEYLLFYRMGDFYELFFEDAITASGALALALTSRSKCEGRDIPMCGVPFHAYEFYLAKLIKMGYKVAIAEQMEDPEEARKRGKSVVERDIVRLVTAGTLTEENLLDAKSDNNIAAIYIRKSGMGIAWLDISTGAFYTERLAYDKRLAPAMMGSVLARLSPVELLIDDKLIEHQEFHPMLLEYKDGLSPIPVSRFNLTSAEVILKRAYKVQSLSVFGDFGAEEIITAGVLLDYVENTQRGKLPRLQPLKRVFGSQIMEIDLATRKSLELILPKDSKKMSLFKLIDRTVTGSGGRLLAERISAPSLNIKEINDRFDMVSFFYNNPGVRAEVRSCLKKCQDIRRAIGRISLGRGGPRDLWDLSYSLAIVPDIKAAIHFYKNFEPDSFYESVPQCLLDKLEMFFDHSELVSDIRRALLERRDDLPVLARNGGFIRSGAYGDVDYMRDVKNNADVLKEELREKYVAETGINVLKVKNNSVIGFFVEVPNKFADILLNDPKFIHRQSVLNAVRFTTEELTKIEAEVLQASDNELMIELKILDELIEHALYQGDAIVRTAEILAEIDVAAALAEVAVEKNYVRPIVDESRDIEIIEGRHPVVEDALLKEDGSRFVGNDFKLYYDNDRIWLLTGPNMAGKSTFLRQNALLVVMAQAGCFIPAKQARIGVVDKIFSRVGASDDLARGRSTFMVEMVETAAILSRASEKSFVILDEIGRGTATYDGLSIAWAVTEQLAEVNLCRTIFATHYHELTKLYKRLRYLSLHTMKTKEYNGDVVFLHEIAEGAHLRSYGIHVAKLAGMPELTIKRAEQVLKLLEEGKAGKALNIVEDELPLFQNLRKEIQPAPLHPALLFLKGIDVDNLSPRDALQKLYELKAKLEETNC